MQHTSRLSRISTKLVILTVGSVMVVSTTSIVLALSSLREVGEDAAELVPDVVALIDRLHDGLALTDRPFADAAAAIGIGAAAILIEPSTAATA